MRPGTPCEGGHGPYASSLCADHSLERLIEIVLNVCLWRVRNRDWENGSGVHLLVNRELVRMLCKGPTANELVGRRPQTRKTKTLARTLTIACLWAGKVGALPDLAGL